MVVDCPLATRFPETQPISTHDFAFAVGPSQKMTTTRVSQRYPYTISGAVTDESGQPIVGIAVCAWPSGRPLLGRLPCTGTKLAGRYELKLRGTPEKYSIWSSDGSAGLILVRPEEAMESAVGLHNG